MQGEMTAHGRHPAGASLCDALFEAMRAHDPLATVGRSRNWCALKRGRGVAYVGHGRDGLRVFLVGALDELDVAASAAGFATERRADRLLKERSFASNTPVFVHIDAESRALIRVLGGFLARRVRGEPGGRRWRLPEERSLIEGGRVQVWVSRYERDPRARKLCIAEHGLACAVCEMDFAHEYGKTLGADYIHVHHLDPLHRGGGARRAVDPVRDLRPVCANCHAMLHRRDPPLRIEELRALAKLPRAGR